MLVISRRTGEGIDIGDNIEITILEATKDRVKIGIKAPSDIRIVRQEVTDTENQNKLATNPVSKEIISKLIVTEKKEE